MNLVTKFDKTFLLTTEKQKLNILTLISFRIKEANENENRINFYLSNFYLINFKDITVVNDEITIIRKLSMLDPWRGLGKISLRLISENNKTLIEAKLEPFHVIFKAQFFSLLFALVFLTLVMLLTNRSKTAILVIITGWLIFPTLIFLLITFNRFRLKSYLKDFLSDLDIKEKLQPTLVWQKTGRRN